MTDPIRYPCGCLNEVHAPSGVLRSASKCDKHRARQRRPSDLGLAYYEELKCIVDGIPTCALHLRQLREALGDFPRARRFNRIALEVGCGASMYAPGLLRAGYEYVGLDPSGWAGFWTANAFDVDTIKGSLETATLSAGEYDLILAAHCIEHMEDAPGAIVRCAELLESGGELWVVVPDDSDPINVDHLFFFTPTTLRSCLESAGLVVERMAVRKYVPQERFLYARARKP
jgi:SAM-dependent methyltransferase